MVFLDFLINFLCLSNNKNIWVSMSDEFGNLFLGYIGEFRRNLHFFRIFLSIKQKK